MNWMKQNWDLLAAGVLVLLMTGPVREFRELASLGRHISEQPRIVVGELHEHQDALRELRDELRRELGRELGREIRAVPHVIGMGR